MVAKMQQPWDDGFVGNPRYNAQGVTPTDDFDHHYHHDDDNMRDSTNLSTLESRSSLGQFIERSTSAPPSSSDHHRDSLFLGTKLLGGHHQHHVGNGTSPTRHHHDPSTSLFRPSSVVDSHASTPVIGNQSYGQNPAPENESFCAAMLNSMIDNSGRATAPTTSVGSIGGGMRCSLGRSYAFGSDSGSGRGGGATRHTENHPSAILVGAGGLDPFQRSHSAAPPASPSISLGPPPGMPALGYDSDCRRNLTLPRRPISEIKRPASTGLLDSSSSSALRPSAKTLMDLIQEDYPDDNQDNRENNYLGGQETPSGTQYSRQKYDSFGGDNQYLPVEHQLHQFQQQRSTDQLQQQVQQIRLDPNTGQVIAVGGGGVGDTGGLVPQLQQQQGLPIPQVMAQRYVPTGFEGRESASVDAPSSSLYPQARQLIQTSHQGHQQVFVSAPPAARVPRPTAIIQGQDGQQVYYQQVEVSPPRLQILPNGQTVYIQAPAPPPQQQQAYATYATIQYQQQPGGPDQQVQQTRIVQAPTTLMRQSDGTYIQIPVQGGGGPQVAYWTDNGHAGQTVIVGAPGGITGHMPQTLGMAHHVQSPTQQLVDHQYSPPGGNGHSQRHGSQGQYGRQGREKGGGPPPLNGSAGGSGSRSRRGGHQSRRSENKSHSSSSPLLEEFRSNKNRQWTVPQIEGHIVEFCQDQNGSRFIQQRLELGDRLEQDIVVREVLPAIRRLRNDVFGNYVVQKLLDFGSPQVRASIRDTLEGEMLQLSLQMYGCRVVQKALEALEDADLTRLLEEFRYNVLSCIHDQNGNHVIQKCIEVMNTRAKGAEAHGDLERAKYSREQIDFIINDILVNATTLSCHPFGCRVLQRILEHSDEPRKTKLLDEVMKSHKRLLDDQYGNYVIQHVLQYGRVVDRDSILAIVVELGLLTLARQKFASNVVEKLLKYGNAPQRKAIAREMLKKANEPTPNTHGSESRESSVVLLMVRDAYANYVVQTTLDVVPNSDERTMLLNELNSHSEELRNYTFAKHIVAKLTALDDASTN